MKINVIYRVYVIVYNEVRFAPCCCLVVTGGIAGCLTLWSCSIAVEKNLIAIKNKIKNLVIITNKNHVIRRQVEG